MWHIINRTSWTKAGTVLMKIVQTHTMDVIFTFLFLCNMSRMMLIVFCHSNRVVIVMLRTMMTMVVEVMNRVLPSRSVC